MRPADPVNPFSPRAARNRPSLGPGCVATPRSASSTGGHLVANAARLGLDTLAAPALRAIPGAVPALPLLAVGG